MKHLKFAVVALFVCMGSAAAQAEDAVVRPTHLFTLDTGMTLPQRQLVVSAYGTRARASLGLIDNLEVRADTTYLTPSNSASSYSLNGYAKYHLFGDASFAVAGLASLNASQAASGTATQTFVFAVPVSASLSGAVVTLVPSIQAPFSGASPNFEIDLGASVPVLSWLNVVGEGYLFLPNGSATSMFSPYTYNTVASSSLGNTTFGYRGGVTFKPSPRVSLPFTFVYAADASKSPQFGLLVFAAHIGLMI